MFKLELGAKATDCVTGFTGIVIARVEYLTGCNQYGVLAPSKDGKPGEAGYFDENRLLAKTVADIGKVGDPATPAAQRNGGPQFTPPAK